ncbi:MAG: D-arabinono-1,4-lactone oxidase [Parvibaculaceae bacterium]|nr:D-arabinono-1,4-lactone oxidase [Parvibaculaceae bacterium]
MSQAEWRNWSGWVTARPEVFHRPKTEEELAGLIVKSDGPVRVAGSGHSFTPICESDGALFSLENMSGLISTDREANTARVFAGSTIRDLGPLLHEQGLGLINQGDIDRQAIAGAVGTGTHGTGKALKSISAAVVGFRLVTPSGDIINCSADENADVFHAGRVSMGSLGIMTEIELHCAPAYALEERGGRLPVADLFDTLDSLRDDNRHFEFFWFPFADDVLVKTLNISDVQPKPRKRAPDGHDGPADIAFRKLCEISRFAPFLRGRFQRQMTEQGGSRYAGDAPGRSRWSHDAFPSDRNVRFNEMEYAVPAEHGPDCVREVAEHMRSCGVNFLFPIEYRYVAADDAWLSPFFERDSVTISIHQYHKQAYAALFRGVEQIFQKYGGRPHWGKLHTLVADDLQALYPRWDDFCAVRHRLDPDAKMLNPFLRKVFGVA